MTTYDFSTLNDKEFEQISRDLLNAKFKLNLQSFRTGKDQGIDLRFSTPQNNNSVIIQAKHFVKSGYSNLKSVLITKELDKIKRLRPDKYIVVTSLSLSASQKDELKSILSPFVLSSNDIIGQDDLNSYLVENGTIEKNYFKLWFSSINVFNAVIHNAIEGRTKYLLEDIRNKIPLYVITKKFDEANKILLKEKLLLITGQPGIGKTSLAEVLLFEKAKNGFKIFTVVNISEAEEIMTSNPEEKQLFYFDDFLGANYNEILNAHKTETQLTSFVERVRNAPNKYLILTTRTVILNHAVENYEKISHSKLANQQFEIKLDDYTKYEKALILYNHLYFNGVKESFYESILEEKFYRVIITHKNYTPRIIAFITDGSKINVLSVNNYRQFIINNLNNPREIWRYSFNNQIKYLDRCLLLTLFSFVYPPTEVELISAFTCRLEYEKKAHNQIIDTDQFNISIKILLNGFVKSTMNSNDNVRTYSFINPSLMDFFIGHLKESFSERKNVIASAIFIEQLFRFNPEKSIIPLEKDLQVIIRDKIRENQLVSVEADSWIYTNNYHNSMILELLCRYCRNVNIDTLLIRHLSQLEYTESWSYILSNMEFVLLNIGDSPQALEYIQSNFHEIIKAFINGIDAEKSALIVPKVFDFYKVNYEEYISTDEGSEVIINLIQRTITATEAEFRKTKKDEIVDDSAVISIYEDLYAIKQDLESELFLYNPPDHNYESFEDPDFWEEQIEQNLANNKDDDNYDEDYWKELNHERNNEEKAIDDLFTHYS